MEMYVKKEFAMYEYLEEESYLNDMAKEGFYLVKALGDGFEFGECAETDYSYRVVYSLDEFNEGDYGGFNLVDTYASSKGGYYHYLLQKEENASLKINVDRNYNLNKDLKRIERFSGIVISSLMLLFLYLFYLHRNPLYLIIVGAAIGLGLYVLKIRSEIIASIKE